MIDEIPTETAEYPFARPVAATRYNESDVQGVTGGVVVGYSFIPEDRIPPVHVRFVRRHLRRLLREVGLPPIQLRWYRRAAGSPDFYLRYPDARTEWWGMNVPGGIALLDRLRGDVIVGVIAHEVRHLTQPPDMPPDEREADAEQFALAYVRRLAG